MILFSVPQLYSMHYLITQCCNFYFSDVPFSLINEPIFECRQENECDSIHWQCSLIVCVFYQSNFIIMFSIWVTSYAVRTHAHTHTHTYTHTFVSKSLVLSVLLCYSEESDDEVEQKVIRQVVKKTLESLWKLVYIHRIYTTILHNRACTLLGKRICCQQEQ